MDTKPVLYTRYADKEIQGVKPCFLMTGRTVSTLDRKTEHTADQYGRVFEPYHGGSRLTGLCAFVDVAEFPR